MPGAGPWLRRGGRRGAQPVAAHPGLHQEIGDTVASLQGVVGQAVALMEAAFKQAEGDVGSVLSMGEDLSGIADAVQRVSDRLAQIATAAEEQAATADEVSGNIQQVDQAASLLLQGPSRSRPPPSSCIAAARH